MLYTNRLNKRAQGLPINTIILIALGLIVLVVVSMLVYNQVTKGGQGLRNITEQTCAPTHEIKNIGDDCDVVYGSFKDVGAGQLCCRKQ